MTLFAGGEIMPSCTRAAATPSFFFFPLSPGDTTGAPSGLDDDGGGAVGSEPGGPLRPGRFSWPRAPRTEVALRSISSYSSSTSDSAITAPPAPTVTFWGVTFFGKKVQPSGGGEEGGVDVFFRNFTLILTVRWTVIFPFSLSHGSGRVSSKRFL